MSRYSVHLLSGSIPLKLKGVDLSLAQALRQVLLAAGGEAYLSTPSESTTDLLVVASEPLLRQALATLTAQPPEGLAALWGELEQALRRATGPDFPACRIGGREFRWDERTYVMGIVNATPDSFSGDGLLREAEGEHWIEQAVAYALSLVEQGADMLDIGGESTRPGSTPVDAETERARVVPVIERLRAQTDVPLSIDTYKASVARAALDAGADWVNDVWGLRMDPELAPLVAERGVPVVIMHNRSKPKDASQEARLGGRYVGVHYDNLLADVVRELGEQVELALHVGIAPERIIVDPGIGFGKTVEQNLRLLNHLDALRVLGFPILLGSSRKSFIGYTLNLPPEERGEGTAATVAVGIVRGAQIVRVHDVRPIVRLVRMTDAILKAG